MPLRDQHPDLKTYSRRRRRRRLLDQQAEVMVSLLKAFYGDAATKDNEFGYQWLPKRGLGRRLQPPAHVRRHVRGQDQGLPGRRPEPRGRRANAKLARAAMAKLDWLLVVDIFLTETAEFWKAPGTNAQDIKTEVFFLPAAPAAEKDGSLTNRCA